MRRQGREFLRRQKVTIRGTDAPRAISLWGRLQPQRRGSDKVTHKDDMAILKQVCQRVEQTEFKTDKSRDGFVINPTLEIRRLDWQCCALFRADEPLSGEPVRSEEWALIWKPEPDAPVSVRAATQAELLALKLLSEDMNIEQAARECGKTKSALRALFMRVARSGIILAPVSRIVRTEAQIPGASTLPENDSVARIFTLQWHLTNRCDLDCRHCYDRTDRRPLSTAAAMAVLDDFARFCEEKNVSGHVSFSGGNPLLRADFFDIYRRAAELGFDLSILGNPTSRSVLERIQDILPLNFFQTSLEGLAEHNDFMRGAGHFDRVMMFLPILSELGISSTIMLTLTRDNLDQIIPLAQTLEGKVDHFTFNRLSPVGEGAALALPDPVAYRAFIGRYVDVANKLEVAGYKDNLINCELAARGLSSFGGCTGFGCGAAFNFMALLPDGQVHACRKYPSFIGDIRRSTLCEIYDGSDADRYRRRPDACRDCALVTQCGGCRAITSGLGWDEDADKDPFCFAPGGLIRAHTLWLQNSVRYAGLAPPSA